MPEIFLQPQENGTIVGKTRKIFSPEFPLDSQWSIYEALIEMCRQQAFPEVIVFSVLGMDGKIAASQEMWVGMNGLALPQANALRGETPDDVIFDDSLEALVVFLLERAPVFDQAVQPRELALVGEGSSENFSATS